MPASLLPILAAALYLASAMILWRLTRAGAPESRMPWLLASAGVLCQAVRIAQPIFSGTGFNFSFYPAMALVLWIALAWVLLLRLTRPVGGLLMIVAPLAAIAAVTEFVVDPGNKAASTPVLQIHVVVSLMAYAILALAAVQSLWLAIQDRLLRNHPGGQLVATLPPLQTIESLLFQLIGLGFVLLTLALTSGLLFLENLFAQHLVHKTILTSLAWLIFGGLLLGHHVGGWRGKIAVHSTLAGFVCLFLGYFGSKFVLELILFPST